MVLILALMVQTVSVAVTAITESDVYIGGSSTELATVDETTANVVGEVEDHRNMYTKVYELQDGSFYEITSTKPLHENMDGNWVEPENDLTSPATVDEAIEYCEELSSAIDVSNNSGISTLSFDTSVPNSGELDYIVVNSSGTQYAKITSLRTMYISIPCTKYGKYTYNQVTIDCKLYVDCQNITTGNMYIHEINQSWSLDDEYITSDSILYDEATIIDTSTITESAPGEYSFDITDLFIKWEKGSKNNYGIAVKTDDTGKANIGGCYITRIYKTIDSLDTDFTYHTVDMGRAGTVYINDYTNSIVLARNELGLEGNVMPVELIRYFDFSKSYATTNPSGEGARWNYESSLKMVTSLTYSWETFEGSTINFVPDQGLYIWADSNGEGYVLTLDANAINYGDFSNVYITSPDGGICYYEYDSNDCLSRISDVDNRRLTLNYIGESPSFAQQEDGTYITSFTPVEQHPCVVSYNRALNYLINAINHISSDSNISLKNLANWFKLNWSISLNYFSVYTDKSFSWPYSYSGVSRSKPMSVNNYSGYRAIGNGYQVYGISFSPISPSGFNAAPKNVLRTRIAFTAQDIANYLSSNKTDIANSIT